MMREFKHKIAEKPKYIARKKGEIVTDMKILYDAYKD